LYSTSIALRWSSSICAPLSLLSVHSSLPLSPTAVLFSGGHPFFSSSSAILIDTDANASAQGGMAQTAAWHQTFFLWFIAILYVLNISSTPPLSSCCNHDTAIGLEGTPFLFSQYARYVVKFDGLVLIAV